MSLSSYDPPLSRRLSHTPAPYHIRSSSKSQALARQLEEAQIPVNHCLNLISNLREMCDTVLQLPTHGTFPKRIDINDWIAIGRNQVAIGQGLELLKLGISDLDMKLAKSRAAAAEYDEAVKTEKAMARQAKIGSGRSDFSYLCSCQQHEISEERPSSDIDILLTTIAKLTIASNQLASPEVMTVIKALRQSGGEPVDVMYLDQLSEQCVSRGWLDEMEWRILNRMKLTEAVWAMWKG